MEQRIHFYFKKPEFSLNNEVFFFFKKKKTIYDMKHSINEVVKYIVGKKQ